MQNGEVSLNNVSVVGGANSSNFSFVTASQNAREVFKTYKLDQAANRDEFVKKLDGAISGLNKANWKTFELI